eukprot:2215723-Amphidinium_carterae.1
MAAPACAEVRDLRKKLFGERDRPRRARTPESPERTPALETTVPWSQRERPRRARTPDAHSSGLRPHAGLVVTDVR